jgi:hypothetical protein
MPDVIPTCIGCNLPPDQIDEYIESAADENMTPLEYMKQEEGTYNGFEKNKFYCTVCYVRAGMPLINGGRGN